MVFSGALDAENISDECMLVLKRSAIMRVMRFLNQAYAVYYLPSFIVLLKFSRDPKCSTSDIVQKQAENYKKVV